MVVGYHVSSWFENWARLSTEKFSRRFATPLWDRAWKVLAVAMAAQRRTVKLDEAIIAGKERGGKERGGNERGYGSTGKSTWWRGGERVTKMPFAASTMSVKIRRV